MATTRASALALLLSAVATAASAPNVIFMILDDMDSLLGATEVMPHYTQRLIDGGLSFEHAYVSSPKCCPSRTSLLSGRFAHRLNDSAQGWCGDFSECPRPNPNPTLTPRPRTLQTHPNSNPTPPAHLTLTDTVSASRFDETFITRLKAGANYTTGFFGKMVNDMGPMCEKGVARVPAGFDVARGDAFVAMCNEVVYYQNTFNVDGALYTTGARGAENYLQAFIGNKTLPWLQKVAAASAAGGAPFFAYLAPHAPHFPAEPAPWYADAPLPHEIAPRVPSYNATGPGKVWSIEQNNPLDAFTAAGIDLHYRNRLRSLMSVDDYVHDIFAVLESTGALSNTYFVATSDHGYHLGNFRIPYEKSHMYETDVRVPFFITGPGVPAGQKQDALVSLLDVGATVLELAGVTQPGERTTDGRSFVPLLGGAKPAGWREEVLIEMMGVGNQWMGVCGWVFNATPCPNKAQDTPSLIDGPQNTYAMLRIVNSTSDLSYAEFRPADRLQVRNATNFTEAYDNAADPWQLRALPASSRGGLSDRLWTYAECALDTCP
jgi:N-acetylglucosamine-6-sulfatase